MFLKNQVVYIQFHPVVYMVKLNIEMSMASLIVRLAQGKTENDADPEEFGSSTGALQLAIRPPLQGEAAVPVVPADLREGGWTEQDPQPE